MSIQDSQTESSLYRAVWRWHFYAGLLVLPFLILLAVTGGLYLFKPELDHALNSRMDTVSVRAGPVAPASAVMANTEAALNGRVVQMMLPDRPDRAVRLLVRVASGEARTAYADPYDARFLGDTPYGGMMQFVRKIHSLQQFGFWASSLIEIAAGWAIILVASGLFLWWPRGRKGGVTTVRGAPQSRVFWRDLHAVTGLFSGVVILFLAITGMPWSMFWGNKVQAWATVHHLNMPDAPAKVTPAWMLSATMPGMSHEKHSADDGMRDALPWAMQRADPMMSAMVHDHQMDIGLDRAIALVKAADMQRPFTIAPPEGKDGVYVATFKPDRAEDERTLYLDQYSGEILGDMRFAQYGPAAKAISWGIAVHQGQQFGPINRYVMLAGCVAILMLAVSAITMWWKRRPTGRIGAPPAPQHRRAAQIVLAIIVVVGAMFPLVGASVLCALIVDGLIGLASRHKTA